MLKLLLLTFLVIAVILVLVKGQGSQVSKSVGPPSFFLQDPTDGLCLAGDKFKRCSIDTLWYVSGKTGAYQIHKRPVNDDDDDECLSKAQCHLDDSPAQVLDCNHCGAKKWNILGDSEHGYVLTEGGNKNCLKRNGEKTSVVKCDKGYLGLQLKFATVDDIAIMDSDGARLIAAAADNDNNEVKKFIKNSIDVNSRDWDNQTALMASAAKGHINIVKELVKNKADVNLVDKDNITALMEASIGGYKNVVEFLVNNGAEVDATASSGFSALWLAAGEGFNDIVKFLLGKKANPNNSRYDGLSALVAAVSGGHVDVVKSLLNAGANVSASDAEGITALHSTAENGSIPMTKLLLDNKADVNAVSKQGFSPLIFASAHGHLEIVKMLLNKGASMDLNHPENTSALMYASAGGFPDVVKLLIEKGADVNKRHIQGGSALLEAATAGNVSVIQHLLKAGADPFVVDLEGVTALISAASQGHAEATKIFLEKGVDINAVANSGGTALMYAAGGGYNETTKVLIDAKADINIVVKATTEYKEQVLQSLLEGKEGVEPHKDGVTALIVAAQEGHIGTAKLLIDAGADITAKDEDGSTALLMAVKGNHAAAAKFLIENGANPNDIFIDEKGKAHNLLMDAIIVNNTEFATLLIEKGANTSYVDDEGVTIITQAAYQGQLAIVQKLLATTDSKDVAKTNNEGINPLIAAASEGHKDILKLIIDSKLIDINARDKDGTNALMAAAVRGHKDCVQLLIENKAEVNTQNVDGHTALMFAYNGKNQVETLLDKYADYIKDVDSNSTKIIKDALQTHVDVIEMLVNGGADKNIKDNEGHVALDFDYKPVEPILEGSTTPDTDTKEEL